MALNPQQTLFKEAYLNPESNTYVDPLKSALVAGYDEKQATRIARAYKLDRAKQPKVYFLYDTASNRVKIGRSQNPASRMKQISSIASTGDDYKSLFYLEYFQDNAEEVIHKIFDKYRVHGEWFNRAGELDVFIDNVLRGNIEGMDREYKYSFTFV